MTEIESGLLDFLRQLSEMMRGMPNNSVIMSAYEYVLGKGRLWTPAPRPREIGIGSPKSCFINSQSVANEHGFRYVEGFAIGPTPIPTLHAWCVSDDDLVIDVTPVWDGSEEKAYYGVAFDIGWVTEQIEGNTQSISVIDNWEKGFPLLKRSTDDLTLQPS